MVTTGRRLIVIVVCVLVAGMFVGEAWGQQRGGRGDGRRSPENWVWDNGDPGIEGVRHGVFESEAMGRAVGYNIYLPPSYEAGGDRRYPVVYFLHGASGSESSDAGFARVVAGEIAGGRIGDVIYVFANGGPYSGYRDWEGEYVQVETMLIKELVPHVDATYRTEAEHGGRAICGFSMGGDGAMRLGLKNPEMFCAVGSLAGAFGYRPGPDGNEQDDVFRWAGENADAIRGQMGLMMVVGSEDGLQRRHGPLIARLDEGKVGYRYEVHAGVGHDLGELTRRSGGEMVRFLAGWYEGEEE